MVESKFFKRDFCYDKNRKRQLDSSKITNMVKILRRTFNRNIQVVYLLVNSWFTCHELIELVKIKPIELIVIFKMEKAKFNVGDKLRLYFYKTSKRGKWNLIISTD